jgi:hypothetical protein
VVAAALAGSLLTAVGAARTSGTTVITIEASGPLVGSGFVYTADGEPAIISGDVVNVPGVTVELQASTFPFNAGFAAVAQTTTGVGGSFVFTSQQSLATRYRVVLASDPSVQSSAAAVYALANSSAAGGGVYRTCSRSGCHKHFQNTAVFPAAVASREGAKRAYYYFGIRYTAIGQTHPHYLKLVKTGRFHQLDGTQYRTGFSVNLPRRSPKGNAYQYRWAICTKDTEFQDGLGFPGHHHCGARRISIYDLVTGSGHLG